jgi:hypothetical protein
VRPKRFAFIQDRTARFIKLPSDSQRPLSSINRSRFENPVIKE